MHDASSQKAKQKRLICENSLFLVWRVSALESRRSAHVSSALRLCFSRYFQDKKREKKKGDKAPVTLR